MKNAQSIEMKQSRPSWEYMLGYQAGQAAESLRISRAQDRAIGIGFLIGVGVGVIGFAVALVVFPAEVLGLFIRGGA